MEQSLFLSSGPGLPYTGQRRRDWLYLEAEASARGRLSEPFQRHLVPAAPSLPARSQGLRAAPFPELVRPPDRFLARLSLPCLFTDSAVAQVTVLSAL
ncbi:hypothetical protein ACOMHN_013030 [Nucella lapillus]